MFGLKHWKAQDDKNNWMIELFIIRQQYLQNLNQHKVKTSFSCKHVSSIKIAGKKKTSRFSGLLVANTPQTVLVLRQTLNIFFYLISPDSGLLNYALQLGNQGHFFIAYQTHIKSAPLRWEIVIPPQVLIFIEPCAAKASLTALITPWYFQRSCRGHVLEPFNSEWHCVRGKGTSIEHTRK